MHRFNCRWNCCRLRRLSVAKPQQVPLLRGADGRAPCPEFPCGDDARRFTCRNDPPVSRFGIGFTELLLPMQ